jgi:P4 family phage/plasmid primase-like protien
MSLNERQGNSRPTIKEIIEAAKNLLGDGLNPIPIKPKSDGEPSKFPTAPKWEQRKLTIDDIGEAFDDGDNIGAQFEGDLVDTDLDCREAVDLVPHFLPATPFRFGRPSKKYPHLVYSVPGYKGGRQAFSEPKKDPFDKKEKEKMLVEIRHGSCQTVMPPSLYPADTSAPAERSERIPGASGVVPILKPKDYQSSVKRLAAATLITRHLPSGSRHFFWLYIAGAMARSGWSRDEALKFHHAIIHAAPDFGNHDADINDSFDKQANNQPVAGLEKLDEIVGSAITNKLVKWLALQDASADDSQINDTANLRFILSHHRESLSYCPGEGWYQLQSERWTHEDEGIVTDVVRQELEKRHEEIARQLSSRLLGDDLRKRLAKLEQLLYFNQHGRLTKALGNHPEIRLDAGTFDTDGWLLGTQNGIYDFRERRLLPGSRELLVSRLVPYDYHPDGPPPRRWLTYLERVQPDPEYRKLLQQIAGACLLGLIVEKSIYFFYGPKAGNGKSIFARVLLALLGRDYGKPIHPDLVFQSEFASGATDYHVASLQNARLLYCPEDQKNRPWNVGFLNSLIGGADPIICRPIREAPLTFFSQAKLIVPSSKKPVLESVDEGFRRRFLLIKWDQKLPEEGESLPVGCEDEEVILRCMKSGAKIIPDQMIKLLLDEAEGILRWAVSGAHALINNGFRLELPAKVVEDTEQYLADEDWIKMFVDSRLEVCVVPDGCTHPEQVKKFVAANGTDDRGILSALHTYADGQRMFDQRAVNSYLEDVDGVRWIKTHGNRRRFNVRILPADGQRTLVQNAEGVGIPF